MRPPWEHAHGTTHAAEGPESAQWMKARRISPGPSHDQSSAVARTSTTAKWLSATSSSAVAGSASKRDGAESTAPGAYSIALIMRRSSETCCHASRATWSRQCTLAVPIKRASIASPGSRRPPTRDHPLSALAPCRSGRRCGTRTVARQDRCCATRGPGHAARAATSWRASVAPRVASDRSDLQRYASTRRRATQEASAATTRSARQWAQQIAERRSRCSSDRPRGFSFMEFPPSSVER